MQMIDVASSNVAAIGYDPDTATLAVRYRDGALYTAQNVSEATWAALQSAPSKGKFLATLREKMTRVQKEGAGESSTQPEQRADLADGPLNVLDEDAGKCCHRSMATIGNADVTWTCPTCGLLFRPEMIGPVRHWSIVPFVAILRPR